MATRSVSKSNALPVSPERYLNRELSWLEFNARVLDEACSADVPLLERLKFMAITTSNLDEFFMVRVAGLKRELQSGLGAPSTDGMTPAEQLRAIALRTRRMVYRQYRSFNKELRPALAAEGLRLVSADELTDAERRHLDRWFDETLFPILTPMAIDVGHPFPVLVNNGVYIAAAVESATHELGQNLDLLLVQVPTVLPRLTPLGRSSRGDAGAAREIRFIPLDEVILLYLSTVFRGYKLRSAHAFRVTRDSELSLDDDQVGSLPEAIQEELRERRRGTAVRLEVDRRMPASMIERLRADLNLGSEDVYRLPGMLNLGSMLELYDLPDFDRLRDAPLPPLVTQPSPGEGETWFDVVARGDVLIHLPYDSFAPVVELVRQAAEDTNVLAIKQTLYRTARDSQILKALIRAAENGKQVSVLMELKARFDEERNLDWARKLEQAGAHVIYGVAGLKTHCKALLIVRREPKGIGRYVHLSTGNYNENTARVYTDVGVLTARPEFAEDISGMFNVITGYARPPRWNVIAMAPTDLKRRLLDLIEREANLSSPAQPGRIRAKFNSLVDERAIDALYAASAAGVEIDLLVRGICRLRPGVKGLSESIRVYSVVDRFLEHSRIFYFRNGGAEEYYLSSADWMQRNFDRRIEVMFPVPDRAAQQRLAEILDAGLRDNVKSRRLESDGAYRRRGTHGTPFRSQIELYRLREAALGKLIREQPAVFQPHLQV